MPRRGAPTPIERNIDARPRGRDARTVWVKLTGPDTAAAYRNPGPLAMAVHSVAVIGGDGIGPEVIAHAVRAAEAAAKRDGANLNWNHLPWGSGHYKRHGRILPEDGRDVLA